MLTARDISFGYSRATPVLRGISLQCTPGINVIIGPNAAGKSTLLRVLAGLATPQSGRVHLDDQNLHAIAPATRARRIAYIAQRSTLSAGFSVREVVALGRYASPADPAAIDAAMELAEIASLANRTFAHLSLGQQQRVALARAIAQLHPITDAKLLLADEPLSAMDPQHALAACGLFRGLARQGLSMVIVLHDLTIAARLADQVIMLSPSGTLAAAAPPAQALTPESLEPVFNTRFTATSTPHGPVLVAENRIGDTSRPARGL